MSRPNLSEYFTNDAPSMFDEIVPTTTTTIASTHSNGICNKYLITYF